MKNGHIRLGEDIHYYSVPYKYIGKKVKIMYTTEKIEVYYRYLQIASHERSMEKYHYTTTTDHLAPQHQFLAEWTPDKFIQKAMNIDEEVAKYISKVLEKKVYPEQSYKSCSGILNFASKVGAERLIAACRLADSLTQYNYLIIEEILLKKLEQLSCEDELTQIPTHENIRGKEYYN